MTISELAEILAANSVLNRREARSAIDLVFDTIADRAARGDKVSIVGFGKFEGRVVAAKVGRNPRTGEAMAIPATRRVVFSPAEALKVRAEKAGVSSL
ncbi:HU family DNA-binding protein [Sphingomonas sp.]|uniref:HU family DNA-binding protein n=1 Tax=Sphingomonas sp. TaxID=28214 RepID=UPI001ECF897C|nr:HU family DNA-binding protein [Sphingomonas sp.]MBX3594134.1 HU family DNA-binding protein [Sphingomonas sp.]